MSDAPRLGIAIVHYRSEELLRECLKRLRRSALRDFVVCVVDNGSADGLTWVDGLDPRIALVRNDSNRGFAAGVNAAVARLPATPWLLLLNPDVLLEDQALERVLDALEDDPTLGAAGCRLLLPDGRLDAACRRADPDLASSFTKQFGLDRLFPHSPRLGRYNLRGLDPERAHAIECGSGAFLMLRRDAFLAAGSLDERYFLYGEDLDLCRTLRSRGFGIRYVPEARALHVKGSGRVRAAATTLHFYRAMWIYYRKWGRHRQNPLVLGALALAATGLAMLELARNVWRVSAPLPVPGLPSAGSVAAEPR